MLCYNNILDLINFSDPPATTRYQCHLDCERLHLWVTVRDAAGAYLHHQVLCDAHERALPSWLAFN